MAGDENRREWEQRVRDTGARLEDDLHRLTSYINDEIIPDVRRHGSRALRAAADELHRLAQQLDDQQRDGQQTNEPAGSRRD